MSDIEEDASPSGTFGKVSVIHTAVRADGKLVQGATAASPRGNNVDDDDIPIPNDEVEVDTKMYTSGDRETPSRKTLSTNIPGANTRKKSSMNRRTSSALTAIKKIFSPTHEAAEREASQAHPAIARPPKPSFMDQMRLCFCGVPEEAIPSIGAPPVQFDNVPPTFVPEAPLLPPIADHLADRITLVLDLDETLVHSAFQLMEKPDFEVVLDMGEDGTPTVFVKKRPMVDKFLEEAGKYFEVIIFTASLSLYANPVCDLLDKHNVIQHRLYREDCVQVENQYIKDLSLLGRDIKRVILLDNSPITYAFQPENAIPISSFIDDPEDTELMDVLDILLRAKHVKDVRNAYV